MEIRFCIIELNIKSSHLEFPSISYLFQYTSTIACIRLYNFYIVV